MKRFVPYAAACLLAACNGSSPVETETSVAIDGSSSWETLAEDIS